MFPPREIVQAAGELLAGKGEPPRLVASRRLKKAVHRLCFDFATGPCSVVVKRLPPRIARINRLVAQRWLPAGGLGRACPKLLGVAQEVRGSAIWHVYEDVGGRGLDRGRLDPERIRSVVELVVELHRRFAAHPLLDEARQCGGDLGIGFFTAEVAGSIDALESMPSLEPPLSREEATARELLLRRVVRLYDERRDRSLLLESFGGPDTLLHGDLWTTNTLVARRDGGFETRLIDWDHAGAGPASYDLSTFLYRFRPEDRPWILGVYREAAVGQGWLLPDDATLNVLFETAECARYASCLAEAARAASRGERWAFEQLVEIERWFADLEPVLRPERRS